MNPNAIAWTNVGVLVAATLGTLYFYVRSAGPAALERKIGAAAYARCTRDRFVSVLLMTLAGVNYVLYYFYPLPIPLARRFPWPWWVSALLAAAIALPAGYVWVRGMIDAGEETALVKKEHTLYGGIYNSMRHPQAVGELPYWWVFAFLLHSPFLALYSLLWIPAFVIMSWAEERDLLIRYGEAYADYRARVGWLFPRRT